MKKQIQILLATVLLAVGIGLMSASAQTCETITCPSDGQPNPECRCDGNYIFFCSDTCKASPTEPGFCYYGVQGCTCEAWCLSYLCVPPQYCQM
jgi:hypothetical protein